jgi:hypothetical protein
MPIKRDALGIYYMEEEEPADGPKVYPVVKPPEVVEKEPEEMKTNAFGQETTTPAKIKKTRKPRTKKNTTTIPGMKKTRAKRKKA